MKKNTMLLLLGGAGVALYLYEKSQAGAAQSGGTTFIYNQPPTAGSNYVNGAINNAGNYQSVPSWTGY